MVRKTQSKSGSSLPALCTQLIQLAFQMPGGLKVKVKDQLMAAHRALCAQSGPDLSAAQAAMAAALSACMENRLLDERPETGLVYTVANLLADSQGRA
ncbi:hypothetical protein [Rhodoferax sp. TH121]|uniref:hypothetical protein n=1 Tax=Rhodoferax sp. TH121 TaxID=2022803 RepID=UPI0011405861|nr:hypothetical protein [Rhodoferax sp. TH121]